MFGDTVQPHDEIEIRLRVVHFAPSRSFCRCRARVTTRRLRCRMTRHAGEVLVHEAAQLDRAEIADHHQRRVVRRVVRIEKGLHVRQLCPVEIGHRSDHRVRIRETARAVKRPREAVGEGRGVWLIVDAQAALFFDRLSLILEILLRDREGPHAVGFEPEREVEPIRRHRLPIVGPVFGGAAVVVAAGALDELPVLGFLHVRRPLEHHVLEQVREPRATGSLIAGADLVPDVHGDDRRRVVWGEDDAQAIRQRELLERDAAGHAGLAGECSRQHHQEREQFTHVGEAP